MNYRELILSDKRGGGTNRRAVYASRRLDLAVAAYREFLTCLGRMIRVEPADRIPDFQLNETQESVEEQMRVQANAAETIMANIFYVSEYQEVYPMLLRDYNEAIQSREYLKNLIEGAHLFIGLLSDRIKNGNQKLLVRRTRVVRAKRHQRPHRSEPKATSEDDDEEPPELKAMRLQCQWESQLMLPLVDLLQNPANENGTSSEEEADEDGSRLFDAVSGSSEAKQLRSAVRRVQAALYAGHPHTALRLARRMWRLWPEVAPVSVNDEDPIFQDARSASLTPASVAVLSSLHKIHSTELEEEMEENEVQDDEDALNASVDDLYNEELGASDPEEGGVVVEKEETIDLNAFLLKFAHPQIVHAYTLLLADYASNSTFTNTALVHTIHRLAVRQKLPGSFFQLRLFYVFQRFIHDRTLSNSPEFKDLANLAKYILRKFFETLQKNPSVVVELLFFKSIKESFEVSKGYGTFDDSRKTIQWTEEQDDELTKLFEAYRHEPVSHGEDLADVLRKHFSDPSKTRRQIIARLITLGLVASLKQLKQLTVRSKVPRAPRLSRGGNESDKAEWTEEEILHLRSLFENHENSKTLLSDIMTDLTMDHELALRRQQQSEEDGTAEYEKISVPLLRPRRAVSAKMLELGLVTDKKSLGRNPRKRAPKSNLVSIDNNGSISVLRRPPKRQRRRKSSSSSEELGFGSDESEASFSDEGIASSPASVDRQSDSEELELGVTNEANLREADIEQPLVGTLPARSESGSDSEDRLEIVTQDLHSVSLESNQNTTEKLHRSGAISEEEFEDLPAEPKQMGKRRLLHLDSSSDDDLEDGALHVDTTGDIVPPETITISREDRVESSNLPDEDLPAEPKQMGKRRLLHLDSSSDDDSEDGALHVDTTGDIVPPETITISREDRVESSNLPEL
ncbi:unnamed protein product [Calicophoron daubneyi]|uniref:Timeless n=1 Tax=Calicophoron daubneyi TaxID=300641 RepID=A0AAV2TDU9_CALDB